MKLKTKKTIRSIISGIIAFILVSLVIIVFAAALFNISVALSESIEPNAWILRRQTTDNVLIQKQPGKQPYEYWRLVDNDPPTAADLMLTGNQSGKWVECVCSYLPGSPTGWVREEFIVTDKPTECGLIATVVKPVVVGDWQLVRGDRVKVLYRSESLCTTIWGFVHTDALDFALTGAVTQPRRVWPDWSKRD